MRITEDAELPGTPDEIFAMRATQEFQDEKCARSSPAEHSVDIRTQGDRTLVTTVREMATDGLPDAVRSMIGTHLRIHETQDWGPAAGDGSRTARIDLRVDGAPVTLRGTLQVVPSPKGSHQILEADLRAAIPFVGGKVEKAAAPAISHGFDLEAQILSEWLAPR